MCPYIFSAIFTMFVVGVKVLPFATYVVKCIIALQPEYFFSYAVDKHQPLIGPTDTSPTTNDNTNNNNNNKWVTIILRYIFANAKLWPIGPLSGRGESG